MGNQGAGARQTVHASSGTGCEPFDSFPSSFSAWQQRARKVGTVPACTKKRYPRSPLLNPPPQLLGTKTIYIQPRGAITIVNMWATGETVTRSRWSASRRRDWLSVAAPAWTRGTLPNPAQGMTCLPALTGYWRSINSVWWSWKNWRPW